MTTVNSPPIEYKLLKNYNLSRLTKDFVIADFERREDKRHTGKILQSILDNEFYDNIFRVVIKDGKWVIIDSRHRIEALILAHKNHGVKKYNMLLAIYPLEIARKVYKKLNLGKRLTPNDILKSYEDGKLEFFKELKDMVVHYKSTFDLTYIDLLFAHHYAITKKSSGSTKVIEQTLKNITSKDIQLMKVLVQVYIEKFGKVYQNIFRRMSIFRNIYRISREKQLNSVRIRNLLDAIENNNVILENSVGRRQGHFTIVYNEVIKYGNQV